MTIGLNFKILRQLSYPLKLISGELYDLEILLSTHFPGKIPKKKESEMGLNADVGIVDIPKETLKNLRFFSSKITVLTAKSKVQ